MFRYRVPCAPTEAEGPSEGLLSRTRSMDILVHALSLRSGREPRLPPVLGEFEGDSRADRFSLSAFVRRSSCRAGWVTQGQKYRDVLLSAASQDASQRDLAASHRLHGDPLIRAADKRATRPDPVFWFLFSGKKGTRISCVAAAKFFSLSRISYSKGFTYSPTASAFPLKSDEPFFARTLLAQSSLFSRPK